MGHESGLRRCLVTVRVRFPAMCRHLALLIAISVLPSVLLFRAFDAATAPLPQPAGTVEESDLDRVRRGEKLAQAFCGSCHWKPPPEILPRKSWDFVVTWMGNLLGHEHREPPFFNLVRPEQIPQRPALSREDLESIRTYYRHAAPEHPRPQQAKPKLRDAALRFRTTKGPFELMNPPMVTLLRIDGAQGRVALGDGLANELLIFSSSGTLRERHRVNSQPIAVRFDPQGFVLTLIGDLDRDRRRGQIIRYLRQGNGYSIHPIVTGYHRISHALFEDLNGNGREDIVVSAFGDHDRGRFAWFENLGDGSYREHILIDRSGALNAVAHDFTGNGLPDLLVLLAQGRNELVLFKNRGDGQFERRQILEKFPGFGYHSLLAADIDGDAHLDLITVNGNNMEIPNAPRRSYHGIRVYRNDGRLNFEEKYFYPMHGAIQAAAADFNQNGLLDLAVISYFPDWSLDHPESFLVLDNQGDFRFTPYTLRETSNGRWMRLDTADLNGDGMPDIMLGNGLNESGVPADQLEDFRRHVARSPAVLVLLNTQSKPDRVPQP
ncbi:MAG: hypothetical protein GEU99_12860 [Luteitalea sp.]|nr:hypothetical protein [Luteitalea sp.]